MPKIISVWRNLLPSLVGGTFALILSLPFFLLWGDEPRWRVLTVLIFLEYGLIFLAFNGNRSLGMVLVGRRWERAYPLWRQLLYVVLDTLSFATLFIWIRFPFDLFLLNLVLQLLASRFFGTSVQGLLSGLRTMAER